MSAFASLAAAAVHALPFDPDTGRGECATFCDGDVRLIQTGRDRFTVVYGAQVKRGLRYDAAAAELGACIMHSLACDGTLNNE